jgi:hypothetical protein
MPYGAIPLVRWEGMIVTVGQRHCNDYVLGTREGKRFYWPAIAG